MQPRPDLTIIQTTAASLQAFKTVGVFSRHRRLLRAYAGEFNVVVYSPDHADFAAELGLPHVRPPWLPRPPGLRHLVYYLWLAWRAPRMRGVVKVFGSSLVMVGLIKPLSGCPVIVTYEWDYAEQTRRSEKNPVRRWLAAWGERLGVGPADLVATTTDRLQENIRRKYRRPTIVLPEWVDIGEPSAEAPARDASTIVYAGRLHWSKGVDVLLAAFERTAPRHPEARLVICGSGPERAALEARAAGIPGVSFRGVAPNVEVVRLLRSAAIAVLPTVTMEGQPKALVEALRCGAACIATAVPGSQELIVDGETGLLAPPGSVEALASALDRLLSDSALRARLGHNAVASTSRFDFELVLRQDVQAIHHLQAQSASHEPARVAGAAHD
jgi:glycosyltransferase involved in cell wall biosynthesis